jgi:uncharacterized protein
LHRVSTGSGVEEYSKLTDSIYWRDSGGRGEGDSGGLYVNLFMSSELQWPERGFTLRQETKFPDAQQTKLIVTAARGDAMAMRIRVPGWLRSAPMVRR